MAIRDARLSLAVKDNIGGRSTFLTHITVDDTLTIANAHTAIGTLATLLATVSDAGIVDGTFTLVNTAVAAAPGADADVFAGAVFDFSNATNPTTYGQYVPSFLDSLVSPGGHISIAAGAPQAFVNALIGAVLGGRYANGAYVANAAGLDAFLSNRKRTKRIR